MSRVLSLLGVRPALQKGGRGPGAAKTPDGYIRLGVSLEEQECDSLSQMPGNKEEERKRIQASLFRKLPERRQDRSVDSYSDP